MPDWSAVASWGQEVDAWITRLDLAHDDFDGKAVTVEKALEWYEVGGFSSGGRRSGAKLIDDLGSGAGKTFYVGKRENGKLARVYEKGKEQGDPNSDWVRVEVEWRNKSRVIPWEALLFPGQYLAGAYPCLEFLAEVQEKIRTIQRSVEIGYRRMVEWLKTTGGKALNVMLEVHQGDASGVLAELLRPGAPKRLKGYEKHIVQFAQNGDLSALVT